MLCKQFTVFLLTVALTVIPGFCMGHDLELPGQDKATFKLPPGFSMHKPNYVLLGTWGNRADTAGDSELKFQLSFKQQLFRSNFHIAYTQKSFWRIWDEADSRPFRETNYNPELFYRFNPGDFPNWFYRIAPGKLIAENLGLDIGLLEHESNGNREPISRSWNRFYLTPYFNFQNFSAALKVWVRYSEEVKGFPTDTKGDENPDIEDFLGNGELRFSYKFDNNQKAELMGRYNFDTGKGAIQADYSIPLPWLNTALYCQVWSGYGESLIDYDRSLTRYGIGVRFKDW